MKSVIYTHTGDSSVLTVQQRELPNPSAGEVRIRIALSGVNPTDWKARQGAHPGDALAFPTVVPHHDGAGVVDAVGPSVEEFAVGDRVWVLLAQGGRAEGTAQQFVVLPTSLVAPLPDDVSFEVGASLGVPALTAHRALTVSENWPSRLHPGALDGANVLVAGGAGAVGHAAIQLARWAGAQVVTTVSGPAKAALATAAGAHHVVNYKTDDAVTAIKAVAPEGIDIVVEVSPAQNAALNLAVVSNQALIAIYANNGGDEVTLNVRENNFVNTRYQFLVLYTVAVEALRAGKEDVTAAVGAGVMGVGEAEGLPLHRFALQNTAAAHDAVESGVTGKVLVEIE